MCSANLNKERPARVSSRDGDDLAPRVCAIVFISAVWTARFMSFPRTEGGLLWWLVWILDLAYLSVIIAGYLLRSPVRGRAAGFSERYLPFAVALLPMLLVIQPISQPQLKFVAVPLMVAGGFFYCAGAWELRQSFSIMVEARAVVERGIYRRVRHPIYLGSLLAVLGISLLRLGLLSVILYVIFVAGQVYRARLEESKLGIHCQGYPAYKKRVPMLGLRLRRVQKGFLAAHIP